MLVTAECQYGDGHVQHEVPLPDPSDDSVNQFLPNALGRLGEVVADTEGNNGQPSTLFDGGPRKLRELLGFEKTNGMEVGMRCVYESSAVYDSPLYMGTIRYIAPIGALKSGPERRPVGVNGYGNGSVRGGGGPGPGRFRVSGFDEGGEPILIGKSGCGEDEEEWKEMEAELKAIWVGIEFDEPVGRNDGRLHGKSYFHCKPSHGIFVSIERALLLQSNPAMPHASDPRHPYEVLVQSTSRLSRIVPGLYLGNSVAAQDTRLLQSLGITRVLNVTEELPMIEWAPCMRISVTDTYSTNILDKIEAALDFIDHVLGDNQSPLEDNVDRSKSNGDTTKLLFSSLSLSSKPKRGILVHCLMGRSRSSSIVIAYIMRKYQLKYPAAYSYVRAKRSVVQPNIGFVKQLNLWGKWGWKVDRDDEEYRKVKENNLDAEGRPRGMVEMNALVAAERDDQGEDGITNGLFDSSPE